MPPDLSVVIPIYNESPNVRQLHAELTATLESWGRPYEIVAVDDGSRDGSFQILSELHAADPRLRVIRFRRNFGQTAAFAAGFAHARGAIIVTSDGDLQNDPRACAKPAANAAVWPKLRRKRITRSRGSAACSSDRI